MWTLRALPLFCSAELNCTASASKCMAVIGGFSPALSRAIVSLGFIVSVLTVFSVAPDDEQIDRQNHNSDGQCAEIVFSWFFHLGEPPRLRYQVPPPAPQCRQK